MNVPRGISVSRGALSSSRFSWVTWSSREAKEEGFLGFWEPATKWQVPELFSMLENIGYNNWNRRFTCSSKSPLGSSILPFEWMGCGFLLCVIVYPVSFSF